MEGNRALINIQGLGITAESSTPLNPGDTVKLRISQVRPQVVLSLLSREPAPADPVSARIRDLLPSRERLSVLIHELLGSLADSEEGAAPDLAELSRALKDWLVSEEKLPSLSIPRQIQGLGLRRESLLRAAAESGAVRAPIGDDLRTLLARLLEEMSGREPPFSEKIQASLKRLSDNLELIRWLNAVRGRRTVPEGPRTAAEGAVPRESDGAQFLPLLLRFSSGEWSDVDLYFLKKTGDEEGDRGEREKAPAYRVVILLNLPSMGSIQIDASFSGKTIDLAFYAVEPATRAKAQERAPELQSALEALGWTPRLTFKDLRRQAAGAGPVQILIPKGYRLIDTRA